MCAEFKEQEQPKGPQTFTQALSVISSYSEHSDEELFQAFGLIKKQVIEQDLIASDVIDKVKEKLLEISDQHDSPVVRASAQATLDEINRKEIIDGGAVPVLVGGTEAATRTVREIQLLLERDVTAYPSELQDREEREVIKPNLTDDFRIIFSHITRDLDPEQADEFNEGMSERIVTVMEEYGGHNEELGNELAEAMQDSQSLEARLGSNFDDFISKLKSGDVAEALEMLGESNPFTNYLGGGDTSVVIERIKKESVVLWRWGVGVEFKFDKGYQKMYDSLVSDAQKKAFWAAFLSVGVYYVDSLFGLTRERVSFQDGEETIEGTKRERQWERGKPWDKARAGFSFALGGKKVATVIKVSLDSKQQSISFTPMVRKGRTIGYPEWLLELRRFTLSHDEISGADHFSLETTLGKRIKISDMYFLDAEATFELMRSIREKYPNIKLDIRQIFRTKKGTDITLGLKLGADPTYKFGVGTELGVRFPISERVEGSATAIYLHHPTSDVRHEVGVHGSVIVHF